MELDDLRADPENPELRLVFGDHLQTSGDARGELIAVQHAISQVSEELERSLATGRGHVAEALDVAEQGHLRARLEVLQHREREILDQHAEDLLGPLTHYADLIEMTWHLGFLHTARVKFGRYDPVLVLEALLASPSIPLLRELRFEVPELLTEFCAPLKMLGRSAPLTALRRLDIGRPALDFPFFQPPPVIGELRHLNLAVPGLRRLGIFGSGVVMEGVSLPEVEHLEVHSLGADFVRETFLAEWPRVARLEISFTDAPAHRLEPMFAGTGMPALRHLSVGYPRAFGPRVGLGRAWVEVFLESPLLQRLERLELNGALDDETLALLAEHPERFVHLQALEIDAGRLSPHGWAAYRRLVRRLVDLGFAA